MIVEEGERLDNEWEWCFCSWVGKRIKGLKEFGIVAYPCVRRKASMGEEDCISPDAWSIAGVIGSSSRDCVLN